MTQFLRRHLALRLALVCASLIAGVAVFFLSRPVFRSRALVRLDEAGSAEQIRAVVRELTQPAVLERTASRLGTRVPMSELRTSYLFDIAARPVSGREIEVEVRAFSKAWAEQWVDALVKECIDFRRVRQRKERADAIRALNRDMEESAGKIGDAGGMKFAATDKPGLARQLAALHELRDPARKIAPLTKRIAELAPVHADLRNPEITMVRKLEIISVIEKTEGVPAWESIEEQRKSLAELLAAIQFTSLAPDVMALALADPLEELERKLQLEFDTDFRRFDADYRNLIDQKTALEAQAAQPASPAEAALELRLGHLAQRIEQVGAIVGGDGGEPKFAGMLEISDRPVSPNLLKIALFSLLGGGALALGVPLLVERFPRGGVKVSQLESSLGLPALGSIPAIENAPPRKPLLTATDDETLPPLGEVFRGIRARLLADGAAPRTLMITSAFPGEGKTTVAANLALAFAESGVRTLIIDTDQRRGRLHRLFGYRPTPGLGDVLAGAMSAEEAIRATPHENLYVLNAGNIPAPDGPTLASEAFAKTVAQLRGALDLLIFDAPPVLGLDATAALALHADFTLIVISPGKKSAQAAPAAIAALRERGAKVRGFVLTKVATTLVG